MVSGVFSTLGQQIHERTSPPAVHQASLSLHLLLRSPWCLQGCFSHSSLLQLLHTLFCPFSSRLSENHRTFRVGRDLCGSPSPTLCRSRVTQSRLHSTTARRVWNISREGDCTASLDSLGQVSITLRLKKFFLMFSWNFLCFSLCPLPLVLSLGTTGKSLAPSS